LVGALDACWTQIRAHHPAVPAAVLITGAGTLGPGRGVWLGHFAASRWRTDEEATLGEVFVGGEGLARGARDVLATLLPWRRGRIPTLQCLDWLDPAVVAPVGMLATRRVVKAMWATWMVVHTASFQQAGVGSGARTLPRRRRVRASKMNVISATGIEPAADLRKALAARKRASLLQLVVPAGSDAGIGAGGCCADASDSAGALAGCRGSGRQLAHRRLPQPRQRRPSGAPAIAGGPPP
jgi:hypothetical protein